MRRKNPTQLNFIKKFYVQVLCSCEQLFVFERVWVFFGPVQRPFPFPLDILNFFFSKQLCKLCLPCRYDLGGTYYTYLGYWLWFFGSTTRLIRHCFVPGLCRPATWGSVGRSTSPLCSWKTVTCSFRTGSTLGAPGPNVSSSRPGNCSLNHTLLQGT